MFNKSLREINFADIENFCREWPEGIRVEYKRQFIENIPKTVSAFANTLGGIVVMGVSADPNTNKAILPIDGMEQQSGLEERLIQSSLTGIYPGVFPEVRTFEVPGKPNKIVAIVKIHESPEAPHAIQNSTRVYIRTGNISSPYDLAEIDRIEYMLKRRERPEGLRQELINRSDARFNEHISQEARAKPYVMIEVARLFLREPMLSPDKVYEFVTFNRSGDQIVRHFIDHAKRIPDGVFSTAIQNSLPYAELNTYGFVITRSQLHLSTSSWMPNTGKLFVSPAAVMWTIGKTLRFASEFFKWANFSGAIKVTVKFLNVLNHSLLYSGHEDEDLTYICSERDFTVDEITTTEDLRNNLAQLVIRISRDAFWAFNCDFRNLEEKVTTVLTNEGLA